MRSVLLVFFALSLCLVMPVMAQYEPAPLDDEWSKWMTGEWEGEVETPMGKAPESMSVKPGLNGQFLFLEYSQTTGENMYKGMGAITYNPQTKEVMGYWIDNQRIMSEGKGTIEGDTMTMEWDSMMGKMTRIMKKVDDDHFKVTIKMTGPDGNPMEMVSTMTRKESGE